MQSVLRLGEIGASMGAVVGGKAANLGTLVRAGFPVPPGFCVTTDAYRAVAGSRLADLQQDLATAQDEAARSVAARARELIGSAPVPAELEEQVLAGYRELGSPPVAVRSSATAEDL